MNENTKPSIKEIITRYKLIIITISLGILLAAAAGIFLLTKEQTEFREISIFEASATATVKRGSETIHIYEGMKLENEDYVTVKDDGYIRLRLDDDKYITLEPGTEILLHATGSSSNSRTEIELKSGAILNEINKKLSDDSDYRLSTPNSVMAIRGTIFRVALTQKGNECTADLAVIEGKVAASLIQPDGTIGKTETLVTAGKSAEFYNDETGAQIIYSDKDIDYSTFPEFILKRLLELSENGRLKHGPITEEELSKLLDKTNPSTVQPQNPAETPITNTTQLESESPSTARPAKTAAPSQTPDVSYQVTFLDTDGKIFATQTVRKGSTIKKPSLSPLTGTAWYDENGNIYDFNTQITKDCSLYYH